MRLKDLLNGVNIKRIKGEEVIIKGISYDTRKIRRGDLFVALKGHLLDGHNFIMDAIQKGASAVVCEKMPALSNDNIPFIEVEDSREALSIISSNWYGRPYRGLEIIGITGTNGKTTTTYLLEAILNRAGHATGIIGTVEYRFGGKRYPAPVTTPESLELMAILREMADTKIRYVIMEVSSHAIDQKRIWSCPFKVGVFTNLSRDHLDYHRDMENYFNVKASLFSHMNKIEDSSGPRWAVINLDDPWGKKLKELSPLKVICYGMSKGADVTAKDIHVNINGIRGKLFIKGEIVDFHSPLIGSVNIYNIMCASSVAHCLGLDIKEISEGLRELRSVPGRMELIRGFKGINVIVDYAHTPDALYRVLNSISGLSDARLITVFGCGGDRDKGKRPEMGKIAGRLSDIVIITSDNPRSEDPLLIISDIEKGIKTTGIKKVNPENGDSVSNKCYLIEPARREAIRMALKIAGENDIVLIAGKGHESYQLIGERRIPFDDKEEAVRVISEMFGE